MNVLGTRQVVLILIESALSTTPFLKNMLSMNKQVPIEMSTPLSYKKEHTCAYRSSKLPTVYLCTKMEASSCGIFYVFLVPNCIWAHSILHLLGFFFMKTVPNYRLKINYASLMKNKSQSNNENKTTITLSWKTHLIQTRCNNEKMENCKK
jgi:hypothetical protein